MAGTCGNSDPAGGWGLGAPTCALTLAWASARASA